MRRIRVDFNDLVRGGQVRVSLRRVEGTVSRGDTVIAYDPDAELECQAIVTDVDTDAGRLYLAPLWEDSPTQEDSTSGIGSVFVWDGHRMAPLTPLATNQAGGMTLDRSARVVAAAKPLSVAV